MSAFKSPLNSPLRRSTVFDFLLSITFLYSIATLPATPIDMRVVVALRCRLRHVAVQRPAKLHDDLGTLVHLTVADRDRVAHLLDPVGLGNNGLGDVFALLRV